MEVVDVEFTNVEDAVEVDNSLELIQDIQNGTTIALRDQASFDELCKRAEWLANSTMIPQQYQRRPENVLVALDMAQRTSMPFMGVMQSLDVIQGKPSWSGKAMAGMVRTSKKFREVELQYNDKSKGDLWGARIVAISTETGKKVTGPLVTIQMAKDEGWYQKSGSKWKTMPEMMLGYRAYSYFGRLYLPEVTLGLMSTEEVQDITVECEVNDVPKRNFD